MRTPQPWTLPDQPASTAALAAGGVSESMLATQVRRQALLRLRQGVYLAQASWPADPADQHLMLGRAEIAANPEAVLSHQSAALVWQLPTPGFVPWHELPPSVTLPAGRNFRSSHGLAVHHVANLPKAQLGRDPGGYPATSVARTAVDLAEGLALPQALVLLDAAARRLCAGFVSHPKRHDYANAGLASAARAELTAVAISRRRSGLLPMISLAEASRESAAESLSAGYFQLGGLPTPSFQSPIRTPQGTFFPDCLWNEGQLIGECDGTVKYIDQHAYAREKEREQILRDLGFGMVRWQAKEIMTRPDAVVARVARALGG
jgi:hypothetical protein